MPTETQREQSRRMLGPREVESIQAEVSDINDQLNATEKMGEGTYSPTIPEGVTIRRDRLMQRRDHLNRVLTEQAPQRVSDPSKRQAIVKERKQLEDKFVPFLETMQDLDARPGTPEYKQALRKAEQRKSINPFIFRWRELGRQLEPGDAHINDLDQFRKDR